MVAPNNISVTTRSDKWKEFVKMVLRQRNEEVFKTLAQFRYKELIAIVTENNS
jgi:hypothetical protein